MTGIEQKYFYRFRNIKRLLGPDGELEKQEIYFASTDELNDPMEGHKNIIWRGDSIVWENLFRHYISCLHLAISIAFISGDEFSVDSLSNIIYSSQSVLPTQDAKDCHGKICERFFGHDYLRTRVDILGRREIPVTRSQLLFLIRTVHPEALISTLHVLAQKGLVHSPLRFESPSAPPLSPGEINRLINSIFSQFSDNDYTDPTLEDGIRQINEKISDIGLMMQMGDDKKHQRAWHYICTEMPEWYVKNLDKLIYQDWYAACFTDTNVDSAMWSHYGESHKGACLKFRASAMAGGYPALKLRRAVSWSTGPGGEHVSYGDLPHRFYPISYDNAHSTVDFFRSIGRIQNFALKEDWLSDKHRNISPIFDEIYKSDGKWHNHYWECFIESITTKTDHWRSEHEFRLLLFSSLQTFLDPKERKLRYDFDDLQEITFGMSASSDDISAIARLINEKCKNSSRQDFEFSQVYYSPLSKEFRTRRLDISGKFG